MPTKALVCTPSVGFMGVVFFSFPGGDKSQRQQVATRAHSYMQKRSADCIRYCHVLVAVLLWRIAKTVGSHAA